MIKFNENHIFGNYIKQLLKEFNLPHYNNGNWANAIPNYNYNQKIKNVTRNLKINSTIYDSHTHEYLGEYLRFIRDYAKVNLMPLYNCFSNNLCSEYSKDMFIPKYDAEGKEVIGKEILTSISATTSNYKIYILPVKFNKQYTIAIDSTLPIEIWAGIYGKYQLDKLKEYEATDITKGEIDLASLTYTLYNNFKFNDPILFEKLMIDNMLDENSNCVKPIVVVDNPDDRESKKAQMQRILNKYEDDLKLFIRLPVDSTSSIAVLEGNYLTNNDYIYDNKITIYNTKQLLEDSITPLDWDSPSIWNNRYTNYFTYNNTTKKYFSIPINNIPNYEPNTYYKNIGKTNTGVLFYNKYQNKSILNIKNVDKYPTDFNYITRLQLLQMNTNNSYPFADRLVEYLTNNAITSQEEISDNIKRVQEVMEHNHISFEEYEKGLWSSKIRPYMYTKMNSDSKGNNYSDNHDILGYVDKEVEKCYDYDPDNDEEALNSVSIAKVDIYPNIYKDSKK